MNKKYNQNLIVLIQAICCVIFAGCSKSYNLSTPENSFFSYYKAIYNKDIEGMSRCLDIGGGTYTEQSAQVLANQFFNKIKIGPYKITKSEIITETEVDLTVEEFLTRTNGVKSKSTAKIKYVKSHGEWKAHSSETLTVVEIK